MRTRLAAACLAGFVASAAAADEPRLSPDGYGKVRFGSPLRDAEAALNERATPARREPACDFVRFGVYPGVRFMVEQGIVTRADAAEGVPNSAGIAVGASLERVQALHPGVRIKPHQYDDTGHYLILSPPDNRRAFVFEEGGGKITDIRAGLQPSVEYVEGCL